MINTIIIYRYVIFKSKSPIYCFVNFVEQPIKLGTWSRGEKYANSIIETLSHWVTGWIDWNMALDIKGGPSWNNNHVDAPILVNASADAFYKQPTYYAMGHFSKSVSLNS